MGYKIKGALQKSKWVFIVFLILWVILSIVLTTSITVSTVETVETASVGAAGNFIEHFITHIGKIGENLNKSFKAQYISTFWKVELRLTAVLLVFLVIGLIKSMPKNEYTGIENGSSDWASRRTV